ncbi:MAG: hypothetical protein V3R24_10780, partial [Gemmatimonadales bacterium]
MVSRPLRKITLGETANSAHEEWLEALTAALDDPACDRSRLCRDTLFQIYHPAARSYEEKLADLNLSPASRAALLALDPSNITLEPEYYAEIDV